MQIIKTYLIIILTSIICFLFLGEFYLTVYFDKGKNYLEKIEKNAKIYEKLTDKKYDARSKVDFYFDLKVDEPDTSLALPFQAKSNPNLQSLAGVSNVNTIFCNENGYYSVYQSDRYGFNNPDDEWESKEVEYLLVGDSFPHGACVNRPHDFSSVLRSLSNKSVINLGYSGNGPLNEYATLREYMPKNVKNIIWMYYGNDLNDLELELKNKILIKYLEDKKFNQNLKNRQNEINQFLKLKIKTEIRLVEKNEDYWRDFFSNKKVFLRFIRLNEIKNFFKSLLKKDNKQIIIEKNLQELEKILVLTKKLAAENNSNLYFVYLGSYYGQSSPKFFKLGYSKQYLRIINLANKLDLALIDTNKDFFFKEKKPTNYFPFNKYGHYTVDGYNKLSTLIYQLAK